MSGEQRHDDGGLPTRYVRIAAVVGGVILIVGVAIAVGSAGGKKAAPVKATASSVPAVSAPGAPPPVASSPSTQPSVSPTPAHPVVRWHGTVTVSGPDSHKDLDSIPPRTYERDSDVRGSWLYTSITSDSDGVQIALVQSGDRLGFTQCRDEVYTNGTDQDTDSLQRGDVLCVLTSQGRIARLTTVSAGRPHLSTPVVRFDVTVWDPPQTGAG